MYVHLDRTMLIGTAGSTSTWDNNRYDLQCFEWCPSNRSCYVFVHQNNVYYTSDILDTPVQITDTGQTGLIYNGIADWLYEREIAQSRKLFWWSPSATRLAFAVLDTTMVPIYVYAMYDSVYPRSVSSRYPRAGDNRTGILPRVRIIIFDTNISTNVGTIEVPEEFQNG
jgi:inactive dipeptidyl peptidase 10